MPEIPNPLPLALAGLLFLGLLAAILGVWGLAVVRLVQGRPLLGMAARKAVPWGLGSILAIFVLYIALNFLVAAGARLALNATAPPKVAEVVAVDKPDTPSEIPLRDRMWLGALIQFSMILLIPPLLRLTSSASRGDLGLRLEGAPRAAGLGMMACVLMLPAVYATSFAVHAIWKPRIHPAAEFIATDLNAVTAALTALVAVVGAPIFEEMLFRGVLLGWLWRVGSGMKARPDADLDEPLFQPPAADFPDAFAADLAPRPAFRPLPDWTANAIVAAIFAGMHYPQWPAPIPLFVLALGLGEVYRRTGNLATPIALHATFNGLSTAFLILISASGVKLPI